MKRTMLLGVAVMLALSSAAAAEEGWSHALGLYIWGVRARGTVTVSGDTHSIQMGGGDIFKSGNLGPGVHWEGYRNKWGFYVDGVYTQANYNYTSRDIRIENKMSLGLFDFGASYILRGMPPARALRTGARTEDVPIFFDLYFGGRYTFLEVKTDSTDAGEKTTGGGDASFVDPVVGARAHFPITNTVLFLFKADVGGFGLGSDFCSQFAGAVHWSVAQNWWLDFLYRWYNVDYKEGSGADELKYNMTHQGPLFGVTYIF